MKVDAKSKLIVKYEVTDAAVHDLQVLENLLDEKDAEEDFLGDYLYSIVVKINAILYPKNR